MSMIGAVKDLVIGRAMRLVSDPRLSRVMGDPRGNVKAELDRASRFAAGVLGFATQEEVSNLRSTIQTLEDQLAVMGTQRGSGSAGGPPPPRGL
jgi:hypothetical protein